MAENWQIRQHLSQVLEALQASGVTHWPWPFDGRSPAEVFGEKAGSRKGPLPPQVRIEPVELPDSTVPLASSQSVAPASSNRSSAGPPAGSSSGLPPAIAGPEESLAAVHVPVAHASGSSSGSSRMYSGPEDSWPEPQALEARTMALTIIRDEVAGCTRCAELARCRTQTVFGVGNLAARLCFVGEAPGADEDRLGEPFVGAAGQLLDRILAACKLPRSEVYILNVLKCRPPQNRTPGDDEMANCWGFATRQLELIQPEFICCLGSIAARAVLQSRQSISRLRGSFHKYRGSQVLVTYHPAYLLRTPSAKQQTWEDMKLLMRAMGRETG